MQAGVHPAALPSPGGTTGPTHPRPEVGEATLLLPLPPGGGSHLAPGCWDLHAEVLNKNAFEKASQFFLIQKERYTQ